MGTQIPGVSTLSNPFAVNVVPVPMAMAAGGIFIPADGFGHIAPWPVISLPTAGGLATSARRFAGHAGDAVLGLFRGITDPNRLNSFPFTPSDSGSEKKIDPKGVKKLGLRTYAVMNGLSTLRSHGINIEYPDAVLLKLFGELKTLHEQLTAKGDEKADETSDRSVRYFMPPPAADATGIGEDAVTLYNRAKTPTPEEVMNALRVNIVTSPLVETAGFTEEAFADDPIFVTLARHALLIANDGIDPLMTDYIALFPESPGALSRIRLKNAGEGNVLEEADDETLVKLLADSYKERPRVWEYNPETAARQEGSLHEVRHASRYYGYRNERRDMLAHFTAFGRGGTVVPLLLLGETGVGKTDLPKTYFAQFLLPNMKNVHMIRIPPKGLLKLPAIIEEFRNKPGSYVIVFDDMGVEQDPDAQERQWKPFRDVYEGASRRPPDNILLVISSNRDFPPNVVSRSLRIKLGNISDSERGMATAMGIIAEFVQSAIDKKEDWCFGADVETYTRFITHDFYGGSAFSALNKRYGTPQSHDFEMSPRGLIKFYLEKLESSGRLETIRKRIGAFYKWKEESEKKEATVTEFPGKKTVQKEDETLSPEERNLRNLARQLRIVDDEGKDTGERSDDSATTQFLEDELRKFGVYMPGEEQGLHVVPLPGGKDDKTDETVIPIELVEDDDDPPEGDK